MVPPVPRLTAADLAAEPPGRSTNVSPMGRALVLNASYEPLCVVTARRAIVLVLMNYLFLGIYSGLPPRYALSLVPWLGLCLASVLRRRVDAILVAAVTAISVGGFLVGLLLG